MKHSKHNPKTLQSLRDKHPSREDENTFITPPITEHIVVSTREVLRALNSFRNGSSGGIDGLRPHHLKDLSSKKVGSLGLDLFNPLTKVVNLIHSGKVPLYIVPFFFLARLTAHNKKDGGIRPIATGNVIKRLAAKTACYSITETLGSKFRPLQMGFGTPCESEAIVHALRQLVSNFDLGLILKLDLKNAFNTIRRAKILQAAKEFTPLLYPLISQSYNSSTNLFYGNVVINSDEGLQQGDPLAPALFCLVIQSLINSLQSPLNFWYLDDSTIAGQTDVVLNDLTKIINASKDIGLHLNPFKCECFSPVAIENSTLENITSLLSGFKILHSFDFTLLGAPLTIEAVPFLIKSKLKEIELINTRLKVIEPHTALYLLKSCLFIPKLTYLLRSSPCFKFLILLKEYDDIMSRGMEMITNSTLTDSSWIQAIMPVKIGGLGIRSAKDVSLPAFLASVTSTQDLVTHILTHFPCLTDLIRKEVTFNWLTITDLNLLPASSQRAWEEPLLVKLSQ